MKTLLLTLLLLCTLNIHTLSNFYASQIPNMHGSIINGIKTAGNAWLTDAISAISDVNGDGYPDYIVGSPYSNSNMGAIYIIFGNSTLTSFTFTTNVPSGLGITINGITASSLFGESVDASGDINGDGIADIIIGAPGDLSNQGSVYVIYGNKTLSSFTVSTSMPSSVGFWISGGASQNSLGMQVKILGDVNDDGHNDFIIGAEAINNWQGAMYLIWGGNSLASFTINNAVPTGLGISYQGFTSYSNLGLGFSTLGDINNDKIADFAVGAYGENNYAGAVYIIFGSKTMTGFTVTSAISSSLGISIAGYSNNNNFGSDVANIGDVNGDGYNDILIGAYGANNAYIIYLTPSLASFTVGTTISSSAGVIITGVAGGYFGFSVHSAGDVNGDGLNDFLIGAPCESSDQGAVYVIFGNKTMSSFTVSTTMAGNVGFKISGDVSNSYTGYGVAGIGDINNDGYADIATIGSNSNPVYTITRFCLPDTEYIDKTTHLCTSCTSSCVNCTNATFCTSCEPGLYVYNNGSCIASCDLPFTQTANTCNSPCPPYYYLYENGTCQHGCTTPFYTPNLINCNLSCPHPTDYYYPALQACKSTCPSSFYNTSLIFCNSPCPANYYLYENGTCLSECTTPFYSPIPLYCNLSCPNPTDYYYPATQTCSPTCSYPNTNTSLILCNLDVSPEEVKQAVAVAATVTAAGQAMTAGTSAAGVISSSDPKAACFGVATKMITYIKFINVGYSPFLQAILNAQKGNSSTWLFPGVQESLANQIPSYSLPENFEKYDLHSSFLVNMWQNIMFISIIIVIILIFATIEYVLRKSNTNNAIFVKINQKLRWNFSIITFIGFYDEIIMYSSFEFRTAYPIHLLEITSMLICITLFSFAVILIVYSLRILHDFKIVHTESDENKRNQLYSASCEKWKRFEVVFLSYKDFPIWKQGFLCIFIMRTCAFYFNLAYLINYPLFQAIIITSMSIGMIIYLVWLRPLKSQIVLLQYIFAELILLIVNSSVFGYAILDKLNQQATSTREALGNAIIYSNTVVSIAGPVLTGIFIVIQVWELYKSRGKGKKQNKPSQIHPALNINEEYNSLELMVEPSINESKNLNRLSVRQQSLNMYESNNQNDNKRSPRKASFDDEERNQARKESASTNTSNKKGRKSKYYEGSPSPQKDTADVRIANQSLDNSQNYLVDSNSPKNRKSKRQTQQGINLSVEKADKINDSIHIDDLSLEHVPVHVDTPKKRKESRSPRKDINLNIEKAEKPGKRAQKEDPSPKKEKKKDKKERKTKKDKN